MMPLVLVFLLIFSSCSFLPNGVVRLCTDRHEIAAYGETFNTVQSKYHLEVHYENNPSRSLFSESPPDLLISEHIAGRSSLGRFRSLNGLFDKKHLPREAFYSSLLAMGRREKQQVLIPLSFDLPILMFDRRIPGEETSVFLLNLDQVQELAETYNRSKDGKYSSMGFSPRWDRDFLLHTAALFGADFTEGSDSPLVWNHRALNEALNYLQTWSEERNGGPAAETVYQEKYLYDPPYRQVSQGRAKFAFFTLADFFLLPENRRLALDFRWLGHKNRILTTDRILFAGIPLRSRNPRGAKNFLRWMLNQETQKSLLESSRAKISHVFGIASGLSSLKEVNQRVFPLFYPHLSGHIPGEDVLLFPPAVPDNWRILKSQVLIPWIEEASLDATETRSLEEFLHSWLQSQTF